MIIYLRKLSFLFLLLCISIQCKKGDALPEQYLPAITQSGANTFGCLINGKLVRTDKTHPATAQVGVQGILISYHNKETYDLDILIRNYDDPFIFFHRAGSDFTYSGTAENAKLTISKVDYNNLFVSGEFEFDAPIPRNVEPAIITKGRFDLKFTIMR